MYIKTRCMKTTHMFIIFTQTDIEPVFYYVYLTEFVLYDIRPIFQYMKYDYI